MKKVIKTNTTHQNVNRRYGVPKEEFNTLSFRTDEYQWCNFTGKFAAELVMKIYDSERSLLTCYFDTHTDESGKFKFRFKGQKETGKRGLKFHGKNGEDLGQAALNTFWYFEVGLFPEKSKYPECLNAYQFENKAE